MTEMETLPDYLKQGLDIIFVGMNPSTYSVREGHYFANPRNRFWAALNRSDLVGAELSSQLDYKLLSYGIGLTDVVKRPTAQGSGLTAEDYRKWAPVLKQKLECCAPLIVCFHGTTAYRQYLKHAEGPSEAPRLGLQRRTIGTSKVYVVPNPSPANAKFSIDDLAGWYRELKAFWDELTIG